MLWYVEELFFFLHRVLFNLKFLTNGCDLLKKSINQNLNLNTMRVQTW